MNNKIQKTIEINAKVKASLEGMEKTVGELERGLEKQKFDLSKNSGLSKLIKDYKAAKAELDELMSGDVIARTDIKKAEQLGGKVSKLYKQIGKSFEDLRAGSDDTFRKLFPDSFTAKISKGTKAIENFFSKLDSKTVKEGRLDEVRKDLTRLSDELDGLKNRRLKIEVDIDKKGVKDELDRINKDLEQMRENFKKKLIPEEKRDSQGRTQTERLNSSVSTWSNKLAQDTDARKNLKVQSLSKRQSSQISKLEGQLVDAQGANLADIEKKRLDALYAEQTKRATIAKTPGARDTSRNRREYGGVTDKELAAQIAASEKELQRLRAIADKIDDIKQQPQRAYDAAVKKLETQIKTDRTNLGKAERALEAHTTQRENQEAVASQKADDFMAGKQVAEATQAEIDALKTLNDEKQKNLDLEKKLKEEKSFDSQKTKDSAIAKKNSSIEKKKLEIQELENTIKNLANDTNFDAIFKKLKELGVNTEGIDKTRAGLEGIKKDLESLDENTLKEIREALNQMGVDAKDTDTKVDTLTQGLEQLGDTDKDLKRAENEMENLKNQVLQFFSLTNAVQLFKRTVQSAINTVKELDAVMTETAVVTDFSVGDMWEKLPEYASHANALGASIKDVYAATTLYYQQGLQTNEAMGVGVETMKMARIANLEAGDATQYMTAALRGFNMEVNELNAQRVNDVYSELAAITAADTSQIATAMSKTASIASAANMEFETTAALLAQIIETTQEAPETAGTALKTIIARFSEVKKLREEGQMTGEDEEGEVIDVNKIQGALRTVGISMDDFFAGTEGLDSVLLKLAEKWKDLDFTTQRYIATTAAGSRQQSRFIAMMSDYERTMELATAANNSAGASQQQFDKTLESMEAKLQKLKNAWDEFAMGLANNEILKFGVDLLTGLLETINNVTSALSGGNGLVKSIISLVTVIGALKGGKSLFDNLFGRTAKQIGEIDLGDGKKGAIVLGRNLSEQAVVEGQKAGKSFAQAFKLSSGFELKNFLGSQVPIYSKQAKTLWFKDTVQFIKGAQASIFKNTEGVGDKIAEMNEINSALARQEISFEQAKAKAEEYGLELISSGKHEHQFNVIGKETTLNLKNIGTAAIAAGSAITLLGEFFKKIGAEKAGETIQKIGTAITAVGSAIAAITPILNTFGITIGSFGIAVGGTVVASLGAIAAVAGPLLVVLGALVGIFIAVRNASPEYQLKKAAEAAEHAGEAANSAAEAYMNLKSSLDSIEEKETTLENLTTGTQEWRDAVSELNNEMLSLIEKYPELAQYVESVNGVLKFTDDEAVEQIMAQYESNKTKAKAAEMAAKIEVERKQQGVGYSDLSAETKNLATQALVGTATEYFVNGDGSRYTHDDFIAAQGEYGIDAETAEIQWNNAILETDVNYEQDTIDLAKAIASGNWDEEQVEALGGKDSEAFLELKKLGQEIIASEAAIKVFTDSLIDSALTTAEISNENAENMRNMYDTEAIEAMIEKAESEIDLSDEQVKKDYAKYMGYDYENGKFYSGEGEDKKEVTVLDKDIKSQMAAIRVQNKLTENVELMAGKMGELAKNGGKLGEAFVNIASKADGAGLTLDDLKNLESQLNVQTDENGKITAWSQAMADLYDQVGQFYPSREEFYRVVSEATKEANLQKTASEEKLTHMGMAGAFQDTKIDTGALAGITDNLYDVFLTSGPDVAQALAGSIEETLKTIEDPEQAQIFVDALNAIDWQNLDDVEELDTILEGMDFDYAIDGLDELKQEIITAAKATKTFNLDKLREEIKSAEDLVKDLKDREDTERTFTKEERDLMVGADASLAGQFIATGIDEFVYVGDSIGTLITALDANTAALLSEYGEKVTHNAEMSDKWQNLADNGAMWTNGQNEYQVLSSIAQSGSLEGYNVEGVIGIMEKAGMGIDSGRSLGGGGYTPSQLAEIIMADYAQYGSSQARQENAAALNDYNTNLGQIAYQDQQKTDRQLLEDAQGSGQNQQYAANQIATEAASYSEVSDELAKYNELIDENGKLKDESQKAAYDAALKEMKFATEIAKAKKEMKDYGEEIDESLDGLEDIEEGTEDYKDALDDMAKQTNKYLDSDIDGAFLEQGDNLELLEKALEGDADAWEQFNRNVMNATAQAMANSKDMATQFGIDANEVADITAAMDALEFDVNGTADVTQLVNEFLAAGGKAEEVAAYLEQLGLTNIDLEAEVAGVETIEDMIEGEGADRKVVGSIKATNVRLAPSSFSGFTGGGGRKSSGGGGGGGGGGSEPKKWENSYNEFYNTVEKLNEALRERERIERRYQKLLDNTNTKASDLVKNAREQLASLEEERKTREYLLKGRERQMADVEREYGDLGSYAWYNEEKQVIEINWTKIEALDGSTNEELTSRIEEYIDKLEEQQDLIEEEQDSIAEIEDAVKEIREQGKDEYFDLESQIKEALEKARQEEIDRLSEINDSINDTNSRLIDAMQSSIDKYRQDRENERTEEELSDKQRRLAYLQQDTSGANALEILQLQEEIAQGQEDYTDTLIDQKISELQKQNDEAAEQRQQQIDLMQAQLDHYLDSELVWADIYGLMNSGIGPDGIIAGSALEKLLMEGASFEAMSYLEKMKWLEELENNVAKAVQWLMEGNSTEALMAIGDLNKGQKIEFTTADGEKVSGTLDEAGNVITDSGEKYEGVYRTYNGAFVTQENYIKPEPPKPVEPEPEPEQPAFTPPQLTDDIKRGVSAAIINGNYGWGVGGARSTRLAEVFGVNDIQRNYVNRWITSGYSGSLSDYSYINMRKKFKQYKTGGLADFTGPAWLDGTKSKPEYILNAEQTKSFFQLVDVLGSLKSGATQSSQITGDNIYDVDINVESIGNDYDVEQLASTIKRMINDDARYRNNNAINLQR